MDRCREEVGSVRTPNNTNWTWVIAKWGSSSNTGIMRNRRKISQRIKAKRLHDICSKCRKISSNNNDMTIFNVVHPADKNLNKIIN